MFMLIHKGRNILVIDLEFAQTYKKKLKKAAIMEVGMVFVENLGLPDEKQLEYSKLFNPGVRVSRYASKVTGITNKMIKDCVSIKNHQELIQTFIDDADILIFHGGKPDVEALKNSGFNLDNKEVWDTQVLAKKDDRNFKKYTLEALAGDFSLDADGAHRALNDALLTLEIYKRLAVNGHPMFDDDSNEEKNQTI